MPPNSILVIFPNPSLKCSLVHFLHPLSISPYPVSTQLGQCMSLWTVGIPIKRGVSTHSIKTSTPLKDQDNYSFLLRVRELEAAFLPV